MTAAKPERSCAKTSVGSTTPATPGLTEHEYSSITQQQGQSNIHRSPRVAGSPSRLPDDPLGQKTSTGRGTGAGVSTGAESTGFAFGRLPAMWVIRSKPENRWLQMVASLRGLYAVEFWTAVRLERVFHPRKTRVTRPRRRRFGKSDEPKQYDEGQTRLPTVNFDSIGVRWPIFRPRIDRPFSGLSLFSRNRRAGVGDGSFLDHVRVNVVRIVGLG